MARNPTTREELQDAADIADFLLRVDSARCYGLVTTDLQISTDRCATAIRRALALGITPDWERGMRLMIPDVATPKGTA